MKLKNFVAISVIIVACSALSFGGRHLPKEHPSSGSGLAEQGSPVVGGGGKNPNRELLAANLAVVRKCEVLYINARAQVISGNYVPAEKLLSQILKLDDRHALSWWLLARVSELQGKAVEARRAYQSLIFAKGWGGNVHSDPTTLMRYTLLLIKNRQWPEAVKVYDLMNTAISYPSEPNRFAEHFSVGSPEYSKLEALAHYVLGTTAPSWEPADVNEMRQHLQVAVRLQPNISKIQLAYGQRLAKDGNKRAALIAFHKAAKGTDINVRHSAEKAIQKLAKG